jgi:hypothetical protein
VDATIFSRWLQTVVTLLSADSMDCFYFFQTAWAVTKLDRADGAILPSCCRRLGPFL